MDANFALSVVTMGSLVLVLGLAAMLGRKANGG